MQFLGNPQGSFFCLSEAEYELILDLIRESNAVPVVKQKEFYIKDDFLVRSIWVLKLMIALSDC